VGKPITGMLAYIVAGREIRCKTVHGKCLLLYYCANAGKDGSFFKSTLDICAETTLAESTVRRVNAGLKVMGLLTWVEGSNLTHRANAYTLNLSKMQVMAASTKQGRDSSKDIIKKQWAARARRYREKHPPSRSPTA
jgi:hypothetical protein